MGGLAHDHRLFSDASALKATTVVVLSTFLLVGCTPVPSVSSELSALIRESAGGVVALSDLEGLPGSSFLVICPYETIASIEERLGFDWPAAPDLSRTDDRQSVALLDGSAVVEAVEFTRTSIDFCSSDPWDVLPVSAELDVSQPDGAGADDPVLVTIANR